MVVVDDRGTIVGRRSYIARYLTTGYQETPLFLDGEKYVSQVKNKLTGITYLTYVHGR